MVDPAKVPANLMGDLHGKAGGSDLGPALIDLSQHPWANRKPDYFIYVYNTVDREYHVARPPFFPDIRIDRCPKNEKYALVMKIPNIMNVRDRNVDTGEPIINPQYGERFAMDVINPQNIGIDMWAQPSDSQKWVDGGSDDLSLRGVFWTKNNPPTDEELRKCKTRLEAFYRARIERANRIASDPRIPREEITPEDHAACDYFQISPGWHNLMQMPVSCENCGEQIKEGVPFHVHPVLGICVRDWKGAVNAGVKKREDVPQDKRWW
jgi:hypothetical protein